MARYVESSFYCINCGKRGLDCLRNKGRLKKTSHMKRLYCPTCRQVCNHYEVHSEEDVIEFKQRYKNGDFIELAKESIKQCEKDDWWCYS